MNFYIKTQTGIAGVLANLTLGAPRTSQQSAEEDRYRRFSWESGRIDYLGKDSFSNIWSKIQQTLDNPEEPKQERPRSRSRSKTPTKSVTPPKEIKKPVEVAKPVAKPVEVAKPVAKPVEKKPVVEEAPKKVVEEVAAAPSKPTVAPKPVQAPVAKPAEVAAPSSKAAPATSKPATKPPTTKKEGKRFFSFK